LKNLSILILIFGIIGIIIIRIISTSKIINRIIIRKNRIENGFREVEFIFIPHSNNEDFSCHLFVKSLINRGILSIIIEINLIIKRYIIRLSIYEWSLLYSEINKQKIYAWIIQILISNNIYIILIIMYIVNVFIINEIEKDDISLRTTCPAVIFAASRNLRVIGRTLILISSIIVRNGFSHIGALSGSKCAIKYLVENIVLLIISSNHIGNPIENVKIICLVALNIYGIIPIMFI